MSIRRMLSVIVDAADAEDRLAGLFAVLTEASVEGLIREVVVAGAARSELVADAVGRVCEDMGAEQAASLDAAISEAKSEWLLVLPAGIRFREGWVERLRDHLASGKPALVMGLKGPGLFAKRESGVLIRRPDALGQAGLEALRRQQGADRVRLD